MHADLTKQLSPATERRHWPERFPGEDATEAQQRGGPGGRQGPGGRTAARGVSPAKELGGSQPSGSLAFWLVSLLVLFFSNPNAGHCWNLPRANMANKFSGGKALW